MLASSQPVQDPAGPSPAGSQPASPPVCPALVGADPGFGLGLHQRLEAVGWQHRVLASPVRIEALVAMRLHALVVDPVLLGPGAWSYLERVCRSMPGLALIVCTGRSTVAQRVRGLRMGADDWVTKPCHPEELIARVEAVVRRRRRAEVPTPHDAVVAGDLTIRPDQFQAFAGGRSVDLTRREFELIQLLADAAGQVLEREEIYQRVWGYAMAHGDRSVDVFVRKLRQKLEAVSPRWVYIHTHFGIGYRFQPEPKDDDTPAGALEATAEGLGAGVAPAEAERDEPVEHDSGSGRQSPSLATPA